MQYLDAICSIIDSHPFIFGFVFGIFSSLAAAAIWDPLKKRAYLRRKKKLPYLDCKKSFTFSECGDDRIIRIDEHTCEDDECSVKSSIDFSYNKECQYVGIVIPAKNGYFARYYKRTFLTFSVSMVGIERLLLEFKSNHDEYTNKTFATYLISDKNNTYRLNLFSICDDHGIWDDVTELVFLIRRHNVESHGVVDIRDMKIIIE